MRGAHVLCDDEYRSSADERRHSSPPRWMRLLLVAALVMVALFLAATLFGPMDEVVNAPGEVRPADYRFIYPLRDGMVASCAVREGQQVKAGQELGRLDDWELIKARDAARSELGQVRADLAAAAAVRQRTEVAPLPAEFIFGPLELDRQRSLLGLQREALQRLQELEKSGGASILQVLAQREKIASTEERIARAEKEQELVVAGLGEAAVAEAREREKSLAARLAALEQGLRQAEDELARCRVVAPEDGLVVAISARFPGELVARGQPWFKLALGVDRRLRLYASEDRIQGIQPGQVVRYRARSNPDRLAPMGLGRVLEVAIDRQLAPPDASQANRLPYRIEVEVGPQAQDLPFGAQVDAEIVLRELPFWRVLMLKPAATPAGGAAP